MDTLYQHLEALILTLSCRIEDLVGYSKLQTLNLTRNNVKSVTRLVEENLVVAGLEKLDLSHNNIQVIHALGKLLIFLSVLATEVDKLFVSVFAVFPLLHELYLNNNNIHTVSPSSFHLPSLTTLDISHNSLSDLADYFFDSSPQLRSINLSHNSVSSLIGSRIQKFS